MSRSQLITNIGFSDQIPGLRPLFSAYSLYFSLLLVISGQRLVRERLGAQPLMAHLPQADSES